MSPTSRSPGAQLSGRRHAPAGRVSRPGGHRAVWSAGSRMTARPASQAHASNPRPVPRCTHTPRGSAGPAPVGLPGPVEHLRDPRPHDPPPDTGRSLGSVAPGSGFHPQPADLGLHLLHPNLIHRLHTLLHTGLRNSLTHLFSVLRSTPRSPATSVIVRPDRTTSARNCALKPPTLPGSLQSTCPTPLVHLTPLSAMHWLRLPGPRRCWPGWCPRPRHAERRPGYGGGKAAGRRPRSDSAGDFPGLDRLRSAGRARRHWPPDQGPVSTHPAPRPSTRRHRTEPAHPARSCCKALSQDGQIPRPRHRQSPCLQGIPASCRFGCNRIVIYNRTHVRH